MHIVPMRRTSMACSLTSGNNYACLQHHVT
jgi:hypothetical protein